MAIRAETKGLGQFKDPAIGRMRDHTGMLKEAMSGITGGLMWMQGAKGIEIRAVTGGTRALMAIPDMRTTANQGNMREILTRGERK